MGTAAIAFTFIIVACSFGRILFGFYRKITLLADIPLPEWNGQLV